MLETSIGPCAVAPTPADAGAGSGRPQCAMADPRGRDHFRRASVGAADRIELDIIAGRVTIEEAPAADHGGE